MERVRSIRAHACISIRPKIGIGGHLTASPTGSPEAVAHLRFPQNVACGFPALRSSEDGSQHCKSL